MKCQASWSIWQGCVIFAANRFGFSGHPIVTNLRSETAQRPQRKQ